MILEKRLALFTLAFYFPCILCDNDASASQKTTIATSTDTDYVFGPIENFRNIKYNPGSTENFINYGLEPTQNFTSLINHDLESINNFTNYMNYNSGSMEKFTSDTSYVPGSTKSFTNYEPVIIYEPVTENELLTTDQININPSDRVFFSSITDHSTQSTTKLKSTAIPDQVTLPNNNTMDICDPTFPSNATAAREVVNLHIVSIGTKWIDMSWDYPCENDSITYLIERCDDEKNCNQTNEYNEKRYNATDLDACTQYIFNVRVVTEFWESESVNVSATTDDAIDEIGNVLSVNVRNITNNAMQLSWRAPVKYAKCISNYTIIQCDVKSCIKIIMIPTANYNFNKLEPCTEYHFTIKTITRAVQSTGVNVTAKTTSPTLSAPQFVKITPGNFSLTIRWEPPQLGSICLDHYRITIDTNKAIFNTTKNNITIPDLHACTSYNVHINAINKDNDNGVMVSQIGTTCPYKTNPPVSRAGELVTKNSISIIWSIEKKNNRCLLTSIITVCNYTASNETGYTRVNGVNITKIDPETSATSVVVIKTIVEKLSPFTSYTCWAYTVNTGGLSDLSNGVNTKTMEDVPSSPEFRVINITDSQFSLTWDLPKYLAGNLEDFEIALVWKPLFPIPVWCSHEIPNSDNITKLNGSFTYDYFKAKAFTKYTVMMRAKTRAGWGTYSNPKIFHSNRGVPEIVSKFSYNIRENPNNTNILDTILTWGLPCSLNGELEIFNISVHGIREGYAPHSISIIDECTDYIYNDNMCSINLKELKGEYNYTFAISTKVELVDTFGPTASQEGILYPAGIPPQPEEEYIQLITIDPYKAIRSTTSVAILLPLFLDTNGDIKYYAIMVSEMGYNKPSNIRFDLKNKIWPNTSSWEEAMMNDFLTTYQATRPKWNPHPNYIVDYGHMRAVKYTIGEDTTCKEISSNTDQRLYCNGPLKPDTWYHVRMRAFTYGGYIDSQVFVIKTNTELNVAIVITVVFGILFLGILTTMMLLVRKCSPYIILRRFLHSDMPGSPVPAPFTRKKFIAHCQQLVDNPGKLSNEFRLLQTLSVDLQMPTNTACLQANRKKNRYSDILPYDFSRVKLEVIDNDPNTDYINASFIRGYTGEDEYIACQGPKEETTYDFWRMVDQYNINIIVMLTQLVEKGKEKCHQYYPAIRETFRYENMTIRCTSELDFRTHTHRTLVLQKENKKRSITHLHFKEWPDHDVPEDFEPMINFYQIMRRNINAIKGFVVIHCSAGIGRTGTLIAIDILLQHLRDNRKLDVFGTVYRLRHHRINMVQRESQYAYIYNCIKQVLKNPYFLKTYKPPPVNPVYEDISKKTKTNSDTNLDNNFEMLKK